MKNISIKPIKVIDQVSLIWNHTSLSIKGPLGLSTMNTQQLDKEGLIIFKIREQNQKNDLKTNTLCDIYTTSTKNQLKNPLIKTLYSLINNEILGVSQGFVIHLNIVGIGYKVAINKQLLYFKLGYSHKIKYKLPVNIKAFSTKVNHLCLYSINWCTLKQTAAKIKALKNPEPYKGKGIRYKGEYINLKIGKKK